MSLEDGTKMASLLIGKIPEFVYNFLRKNRLQTEQAAVNIEADEELRLSPCPLK